HQTPYSYLDLHARGSFAEGRIAAHVVDLAHEMGLAAPDSLLDSNFVARRSGALEQLLEQRLDVRAGGARLRPEWTGWEITRDRKRVAFRFRAALAASAGRIEVRGPLFPYDPAHETYVNVYDRDAIRAQDVLDAAHPSCDVYLSGSRGVCAVARTFIPAGIHHIFLGPDHILFIIGLLLLGGSLGRLLKIVTAFTVAHSITLALAALQIVNPSARVIEPAIALSIVVVGAENLLGGGRRDLRAAIAFAFGFVHGFGFASVLHEFGLPPGALGAALFSFNAGIEVGQMCIVLALAPLLTLARSWSPALAMRIATVGSAGVIAAGAYWFVQRVFFA
ncbi:MAG: HupE/UreJ family protein, partial [Candidatus Eisenbacteria bacterium]|nr:HupE/UreJ family protein [Candidatus Eisenbacteria bacterium]